MSHAVAAAALVFLAGCAAGALNSVAGGGSFISFPTLLFLGLPPIVANASNNTAMWLGTFSSVGGYREELRGAGRFWPALAVALLGSLAGAILLLHTPEPTFTRLIPWLLLVATVIFAGSERLGARGLRRHRPADEFSLRLLPVLFAVSIYGGYFGAGMGIAILALFALSGWTDIHRMNGLKSLLATSINGVAVIPFVIAGRVDWPQALILAAGAIAGGYGGARVARRLDPRLVRRIVVCVGAGMTLAFFLKGM